MLLLLVAIIAEMAKKSVTKESIQKGFQDYLLNEGKTPETVRQFTKYLKISDDNFYSVYGSLTGIESSIWIDYYSNTLKVLQKDPDFDSMSGREKHLSFLYTLLEIIKSDRSYILFRSDQGIHNPVPRFISGTRKVITEAEIEWVTPPKFVPEKGQSYAISGYKNMLWKHSLAMIYFWVKDDSPAAEDTDAFIEKSTRTLFDVGELPALESILDLGKFFLQKMGFSKATA